MWASEGISCVYTCIMTCYDYLFCFYLFQKKGYDSLFFQGMMRINIFQVFYYDIVPTDVSECNNFHYLTCNVVV